MKPTSPSEIRLFHFYCCWPFWSLLLICGNLCYQDEDFGYQKVGLTHHLSLPGSSSRMATMEKLYQIQGSVPCKIRAKRGFATHPRSIAERVKVSFDSTVTLDYILIICKVFKDGLRP